MTALTLPAADAPAEEWGYLASRIPGFRPPPSWHRRSVRSIDPDHWAWEGWLLRMLGPGWCWQHDEDGWELWGQVGGAFFRAPTLGRACIAAAAALGRWPGGGA